MKVLVVFVILAVGIQSTYIPSPLQQEERAAFDNGVQTSYQYIDTASQSGAALKNVAAQLRAKQFSSENIQTQFFLGFASVHSKLVKQATPQVYPFPLESPFQDKGNPDTQLDIAWKAGFNEMFAIYAAGNNLATFMQLVDKLLKTPFGPYGTVADTSSDLLSQLQDKYWSGRSALVALLKQRNNI